jgi:hypothetical protein
MWTAAVAVWALILSFDSSEAIFCGMDGLFDVLFCVGQGNEHCLIGAWGKINAVA